MGLKEYMRSVWIFSSDFSVFLAEVRDAYWYFCAECATRLSAAFRQDRLPQPDTLAKIIHISPQNPRREVGNIFEMISKYFRGNVSGFFLSVSLPAKICFP